MIKYPYFIIGFGTKKGCKGIDPFQKCSYRQSLTPAVRFLDSEYACKRYSWKYSGAGHLDHTVFQVKNSFFVEGGYNFFVFVVGGNGRVV